MFQTHHVWNHRVSFHSSALLIAPVCRTDAGQESSFFCVTWQLKSEMLPFAGCFSVQGFFGTGIREVGVEKLETPSSLMLLVRLNYSSVSNDMFRRVLPECLIGICSRKKKKKHWEVCFTSPYQTTKVTKDTIGPCSSRSLNIPSSSTNI